MSLLDRAIAGTVPHLPRGLVGAVSRRYIAGETLESALETTRALNERGISATMDVLGENITAVADADPTVEMYHHVLRELADRRLDGNISVKPTHLGLKLDRVRCAANVRSLVAAAAKDGIFVRIDMEDSSTTSDTLEIFREMREEHANVGVVLQAMLRRSEHDARDLAKMGARIRVCKGIYREPPDIAYQQHDEINHSYLRIVELLLDHGCHVAIATHDEELVNGAMRILETQGGCVGSYEFQMLLGVAEGLRDRIVAAGHPLRVYVPFGSEWYAYSLRRLRENPAIAGHVFRAMFRRS
ncbi:proline dehydrogenase family protein [bacterium]|nr:proline dehydrogenase family protein [bacterium]